MSKRQMLMILGLWVIVLPFLGFPSGWDTIIAVITGIFIAVSAYSLKPEKPFVSNTEVPFVEHKSESAVSSPPLAQPSEDIQAPSMSPSVIELEPVEPSEPVIISSAESVTSPNPAESS